MQVRAADDETVDIQMAPLIDCMFLLLIFFLVATTLKRIERELPVELPQAAVAEEVEAGRDRLVIGIDVVGNLYVDQENVGVNGREACRNAISDASRRGLPVRVDADRSVSYWRIVEVVSWCQARGVDNVRLHIRDEDHTPD